MAWQDDATLRHQILYGSRIKTIETIRNYIAPAGPISDFTYRCLVGMIETGEATYGDMEEAGGEELAAKVRALKDGEVYR